MAFNRDKAGTLTQMFYDMDIADANAQGNAERADRARNEVFSGDTRTYDQKAKDASHADEEGRTPHSHPEVFLARRVDAQWNEMYESDTLSR